MFKMTKYFLSIIFCITFNNVTFASEHTEANDTTSVKQQEEAIKKSFNQVRKRYSYDPETDKWSAVGKFDEVQILNDSAAPPPEQKYIYHNFWAHDALKHKWDKIDIPEYGYKDVGEATEKKYLLRKFFSNLALDFNAGVGGTLYKNTFGDVAFKQIHNQFYLQPIDDKNRYYLINWYSKTYSHVSSTEVSSAHVDVALDEHELPDFENIGVNFPITLGLHYTLFKLIRIGGGTTFQINLLKNLKPTRNSEKVKPIETLADYFYDIKYFGLLGVNLIHQPNKYYVVVDTHIGSIADVGDEVDVYFKKHTSVRNTWFADLGVSYERVITNSFRLLGRLAYEYKAYKDTFSGHKGYINLNQQALFLQVGLSFNLAKSVKDKYHPQAAAQANNKTPGNKGKNNKNKVGDTAKKLDQTLPDAANKAKNIKDKTPSNPAKKASGIRKQFRK